MTDNMYGVRSITTASFLIAIGVLRTCSVGSAVAQNQVASTNPMEVISDTPEYCLHLLDRVSKQVRLAIEPVPHDVTDLTTEGHRMCTSGQTRGGIMRLRSALMMMEKSTGTTH